MDYPSCPDPRREELNNRYERAAAIAVFQGNIRRAIPSLKDGASVARRNGDRAKSECQGGGASVARRNGDRAKSECGAGVKRVGPPVATVSGGWGLSGQEEWRHYRAKSECGAGVKGVGSQWPGGMETEEES